MREVITYVSFDEQEFDTKEECQEHETTIYNYLDNIASCYTFYKKNMETMLFAWPDDLEEGINSLDSLWNESEYVRVLREPDDKAFQFIIHYIGIRLPDKVGLYKYDYIDNNWISIS